jgi:hypothetical protein
MHVRVPDELKAAFAREIRRNRLSSSFRLYVPIVLIFFVVGYLGLAWKGHPIIYILSKILGDSVPESRLLLYITVSTATISALGALLFLRHLVTKELFEDFPYCARCDALDYDEIGICSCCRSPLIGRHSFFYLEFEDERKTIESFGLKEIEKMPDPVSKENSGK